MGLSFQHVMVVAVIALLLFGRGRISEMMGDFAKGIKAFKKGLADEETAPQASQSTAAPAANEPMRTIPHAAETAPGTAIPASHISQADKV